MISFILSKDNRRTREDDFSSFVFGAKWQSGALFAIS
jgi:hypothetical protein